MATRISIACHDTSKDPAESDRLGFFNVRWYSFSFKAKLMLLAMAIGAYGIPSPSTTHASKIRPKCCHTVKHHRRVKNQSKSCPTATPSTHQNQTGTLPDRPAPPTHQKSILNAARPPGRTHTSNINLKPDQTHRPHRRILNHY